MYETYKYNNCTVEKFLYSKGKAFRDRLWFLFSNPNVVPIITCNIAHIVSQLVVTQWFLPQMWLLGKWKAPKLSFRGVRPLYLSYNQDFLFLYKSVFKTVYCPHCMLNVSIRELMQWSDYTPKLKLCLKAVIICTWQKKRCKDSFQVTTQNIPNRFVFLDSSSW